MNLLDLFVHIGAKDDATGVIDNVSDVSIGKLVDAAKKAATALAQMWAVKKVYDFGKAAFDAYSEFEQLAGGAEKIFDEMDQSKILEDANGAWKTLNMSANEYLASINQTGAMFAQTMGDEKGYDTAKKGMQAISDYATGTGRDINLLNEKYGMITRSAGSYQSIADQFSGILPATSKDFLEQAKAAGFLEGSYEKLTDVPMAEYQEAVTNMLEKGVEDLGLANNTAKEALGTLSGSVLATKSAWQNLVAEFGKPDADIGARISDMMTAVLGENGEGGLLRNVTKEVGTIARNIISAIGKGIADGVSWLISNGPKLVLGAVRKMISSIGDVSQMIGSFDLSQVFAGVESSGFGDSIMQAVGNIGEILREWWPDIQSALGELWSSVAAFVTTNWPLISEKLSEVATNVLGWLSGVAQTVYQYLIDNGPQIVSSLAETGMQVLSWLVSMGGELIGHVGEILQTAVNFLVEHREEILGAMGEALTGIVNAIVEYGPDILMSIATTVGEVIGYLVGAAGEIIMGLGQSLEEHWTEITDWFSELPQKILDALGDLGSLLLDAGQNVIQGFLDGLGSKWDEVSGWFGSLTEKIPDWKGPREKDLSLLTKNGMWIMDSLETGLEKGLPSVENTLSDITDSIQTGINTNVSLASAQPHTDAALMGLLGTIRDNMDMKVYLDSGRLVGGIAPQMNVAMGRL